MVEISDILEVSNVPERSRSSEELRSYLEQDVPLVRMFCETYKVNLTEVHVFGFPENPGALYFFSDDLGGYSRIGLRKSLDDC